MEVNPSCAQKEKKFPTNFRTTTKIEQAVKKN